MPSTKLPRRRPEEAGVDPQGIIDFLDAAAEQKFDLRSFMLLRRGEVLAEGWWGPHSSEDRHAMYSVSKSFTSTAIGMAVDEGLLTVEDKVADLLPQLMPADPHPNLLKMTVHDLLVMGTGHKQDPLEKARPNPESDWARIFLAAEVENVPGSTFSYSSGATYMLSVILQTLTGEKVVDYLESRLFAPLGIKHKTWQESPQGYTTGGWGLKLSSEDLAKFGQFYLQKGMWDGQRLVSEKWVDLSSSKRIDNGDDPHGDWGQGYGYQFWVCRHNAYRADGAYGQFCLVLPDQEAVVVLTSAISRTKELLDEVWNHLLPAMQDHPLTVGEAGDEAAKRLSELQNLPEPAGATATDESWSGRTYRLSEDSNEGAKLRAVRFTANEDLSIRIEAWMSPNSASTSSDEFNISILSGAGEWQKNEAPVPPGAPGFAPDTGAAYAWNSRRPDGSVRLAIRFAEEPILLDWTLVFDGDKLQLKEHGNSELNEKETQLIGTAENPSE